MDPLSIGSMMSMGSSIGSLFGGKDSYKNPADAANPYLDQIEGKISPYYSPYIDSGKESLGKLMEQYRSLLSDPTAIMNKMGSTYQKSPGYDFQLKEGTRAMNQGAAAGGMVGSPQEQAQLAEYSQGLANKDYEQYLQNAMGMYGKGMSGMSDINQMGYGASDKMAQSLKDVLESKAKLAYSGAANENEANSDFGSGFSGLFSSFGGGGGGGQSLADLTSLIGF